MLGAIAGDVIGSPYEWRNTKKTDFPLFTGDSRFTDDSVLTVATASAILSGRDYADAYWNFGRRYPKAGYGGMFRNWLKSNNPRPYQSYGNGSAMRVSPVGFVFKTTEEVLSQALQSAAVTHDHPEGIKGAQATALAIFMARTGGSKKEIRDEISARFGYNLDRTIEEIRPSYSYNGSCQGTVPEAIIAFLDSSFFEHAIRLAVSLGGDSDTLTCITGGIAQAFYGKVPEVIETKVLGLLTDDLRSVVEKFRKKYGC